MDSTEVALELSPKSEASPADLGNGKMDESPTHSPHVAVLDPTGPVKYRLYKMRWWVLATLAALNFSNAMVSQCRPPISGMYL